MLYCGSQSFKAVFSDIGVSGKHITFFFRVKVSQIVEGKVGRKTSDGKGSDISNQGREREFGSNVVIRFVILMQVNFDITLFCDVDNVSFPLT
jgi:hypothetical protein